MKPIEKKHFKEAIHMFLGYFLANEETSSSLEITPYMHWLVHHSAASLERHGPLGLYSCESLERHNSFLRRFVHKSSNNRDPALYAFEHEQIIQCLSFYPIKKRDYQRRRTAAAQVAATDDADDAAGDDDDDDVDVDDADGNGNYGDINIDIINSDGGDGGATDGGDVDTTMMF